MMVFEFPRVIRVCFDLGRWYLDERLFESLIEINNLVMEQV